MVTPETGPQPDYAINVSHMRDGITWFLTPVIKRLAATTTSFTAAQTEIRTAHESQATGWFAGDGSGDLRSASGSFLNEVEYQLRLIAGEQTELLKSLEDYRTMLEQHIAAATRTEQTVADRFRAIDRQLDAMGH